MAFKEIARKPFSSRPGDAYLAVVLNRVEEPGDDPEYATHLENSSGERPFLAEGAYFDTEAEAREDFARRGRP